MNLPDPWAHMAPAPGETPHELTEDEIRHKFLWSLYGTIDYWHTLPDSQLLSRDPPPKDLTLARMEGMAFSILAMLDGSNISIPQFIVAPNPHPDDRPTMQTEGKNWWPENDEEAIRGNIGGTLHDHFHEFGRRYRGRS